VRTHAHQGGLDGEGDDVDIGGADSGDDKDMMDNSGRTTAVGSRGGGAGMSAAVAKVYTGEETVRLRGKHWYVRKVNVVVSLFSLVFSFVKVCCTGSVS
jgi:hypothetical protein